MKLVHKPPPVRQLIERDRRRHRKALYTAAQNATDGAIRKAKDDTRTKIRQVGLKGLANAVGDTSSKRKRQKPDSPYGAIYARGGDKSRAGQALESYTKGATILPRRGRWLAFATKAVPRTINRRRTTPELYKKSGLVTSIGQLQFVRIKPNVALLVVRNVTLSPRTGRAKRAGKGRTRTRIPAKQIVAFVLIKVTRRAVRFNKDRIVNAAANTMPDRLHDELEKLLAR